ncbi:hypothetical protein Tco_0630369 [Tanacetum coccineum]
MLESEAYMTYHAYATGEKTPKPKSTKKKVDSESSPKTKLTQASKGKRIKTVAKGDKHAMKKQSVTKSKGVPDVPTYKSDDEQISWKSSKEEDDDEVNVSKDNDDDADKDTYEMKKQTNLDNDGDDFVHPKISTHDDEARQDDEVNKEESDDESNEELVKKRSSRDVNINLEGRDTMMTNASLPNVQGTQVTEDTHVIITALINPEDQQQSSSMSSGFVSNMLNPSPDTGIDTIFTPNTEATSLVDVPVTTNVEPPLLSATLPPTPLFTHLQQTPVPIPATVPRSSLQDLSNFGSLFGFDHRLKTLETNFAEFKQTNQFAEAVSSIPGIVDAYLANKMHEAVKTTVQLQSKRLRDEAQAENADFLNKLDDNIKKIIKDQVKEQVKAQVSKILQQIKKTVNEQLEAKVMTRLSTESKTSLAFAANLSELELKNILIDKTESNKSIHISDEQKNLYKALVDAYKSDKLILNTYGDTVSFKRRRDDEDKDEEPSAGSNRGPTKLPSPDHDWNKTLPDAHGPIQPWLSSLAQKEDPRESFNELMDTPIDFLAFVMNRLKCKSLVELEYLFEEVYKETTKQFDWNNPESQQYPHDLQITGTRLQITGTSNGLKTMARYLSGGISSRKYATSVMKTKAVDYWHIKWIEDLVPNRMWSQVPVRYDKHALWGISHWGRKRQQLYGFATNRESARDVYSKRRIIAVTKLEIVDWHNYKHLDWITVHRDDDKLYKFKEDDFNRLRIQYIEDISVVIQACGRSSIRCRKFTILKKLNLTKPDTYRPDPKRREAYTAYSNPRGFIYPNKDKKNRLMRIDELHKFSDGTLNDVRTALNDRLKGIRIEYLPQTIWRQSDKEKTRAMIQAIDKQLKTRRIMWSLEKFIGERPYEGDFWLLQRTI